MYLLDAGFRHTLNCKYGVYEFGMFLELEEQLKLIDNKFAEVS
jgi:hypothetical protein